jgi:hypothetical protein
MAYIGSRQALYKQALNNANKRLNVLNKDYEEFLRKLIDPAYGLDFWNKAGLVAGSAGYDFLMGMGKSLTGFVSGVGNIALELLNDGVRVLGTGDELMDWFMYGARNQPFPEEVKNEFGGLLSNFANNFIETFAVTGINLAATGQNVVNTAASLIVGENVGWQADWAPKAIERLALLGNRQEYYMATGETDRFGAGNITNKDDVNFGAPIWNALFLPEDNALVQDAYKNRDKYQQYNEGRRFAAVESAIRGSVAAKKWIDSTILDGTLDLLGVGLVKEEAQRVFANSELYQMFSGSMESIGAIMASRALNSVARAYNIKNPDQISQTYFGVQIFGNSFAEAVDRGATLDDAFMYATSSALIESAIESLGGAKVGGVVSGKGSVLNALKTGFLEEGLEELLSEFATPGFDYYAASPEDQKNFIFERLQNDTPDKQAEFMKRLFFSYVSGGITGGALQGSNQLLFNPTFEGRVGAVEQAFKQNIAKVGEEKALKTLKGQVQQLVKTLNQKTVKGIVANKQGDAVQKNLNRQERLEKIRDLGLEGIINIKYEGEVKTAQEAEKAIEEGSYTFEINPKVVFDKTIFQASYGKQGKVSNEVLAINKGTQGAELETNNVGGEKGVYDIVTREEANQSTLGKEALALADETNVPIAVVKTRGGVSTSDIAWYNSKNGVIYINQNANVSKEELRQEVLKHELVHAVASKNRALYGEIKKLVDEVVKITVDKDGKVNFELNKKYNNGSLYKYLEGKGNFTQKLQAAFDDITDIYGQKIANLRNDIEVSTKEGETKVLKRQLKMLTEVVQERMNEEIVAYFVENMVKDTNQFLNALEGKEQTLVEKFTQFFEGDEKYKQFGNIGERTKTAIKKITKKLAEGTRQFVETRQRLDYFYRNYFGQQARYENYIAPEILKKYGVEKIVNAMLDANRNGKGLSVIVVDGDYLQLKDIFIGEERPQINLKKVDFKKRDLRVEFFKNWKFDPQNVTNGTYSKRLLDYSNVIDAEIEEVSLSLSNKDRTQRTYTKKDGTTYISSEYEEARKRKSVLQNRLLAVQLLERDISLGLGIDKDSDYLPELTLKEFIQNNGLQRQATLLKTTIDEASAIYGNIFAQTNIRNGVKLSAENKANLLKSAEFEAQGRVEKAARTVAQKKQLTPEQIRLNKNIKLASYRAGKRAQSWIERHAPSQFGIDAGWSNKAYSTDSINDIQGIYAEFDFSDQVLQIANNKDRIEAMKNKSEDLALLFSTFVGQTVLAKNGKKFTLGLESYDVEADVITNEKGLLSVIRVGIIPNKTYVESVMKDIEQEQSQLTQPQVGETTEQTQPTTSLSEKIQKKVLDDAFKMIRFPMVDYSNINNNQDITRTVYSINSLLDEKLISEKVKSVYPKVSLKVINPLKGGFTERNAENGILSPHQSIFFRDVNPLLRDKEGKMRVYYHGTSSVFNEFSYKPIGTQGTASGYGFYFTDDKDTAKTYAMNKDVESGKLKKVYLNITKPIEKADYYFTDDEVKSIFFEVFKSLPDFDENNISEEIKAAFLMGIPDKRTDSDLFNKIQNAKTFDQFVNLLKEVIGFSGYRSEIKSRAFVNPLMFIEKLVEAYQYYNRLTKVKTLRNITTSEQLAEFIYIGMASNYNEKMGNFQRGIDAYYRQIVKDQKDIDVELGSDVKKVLTLINEATGYDGVIDLQSSIISKEDKHVAVAWFPEQIKSVDTLMPTLSAEINEASIDENGQLMTLNQMIDLVAFNKDSSAFVIPFTELNYIISSIEKASKVSPFVAAILPANWSNSLELQKNLPENLKVIKIARIGKGPLRPNPETRSREYNLIAMELVDKTDERFFDSADLRETRKSVERFTTNDLEIRFMNKRSAEDDARVADFFKDANGNINITFAVPFTGENVDYSQKYTRFEDIPANGKFVVIKGVNADAEQILNAMDFKRLSENSSIASNRGFLGRDIIGEYNLIKRGAEAEEYEEGVFKKVSPKVVSTPASVQQRAEIMRVFGDAVVRDMFEVDKKGNLVLKSKNVPEKRGSKNKIKINNIEYSGDVYALHMPVDNVPNVDVKILGKNDIAKINELGQAEKASYEFMITTGIPFVMFKDPKGPFGFYYPAPDSYVSFINVSKGVDTAALMKTLIHEFYHNLFRNETRSAEEVSAQLALMMFEIDPATNTMGMSQAGKNFFDQKEGIQSQSQNAYESYGFNLFLSTLQRIDSYKFMKKVGRDAKEIFEILSTPNATIIANSTTSEEAKNKIQAKNEVTAQIVGYLFSDFEAFRKMFDSNESLRVPMYEIYSKFLTDANKYSTESSKRFMRSALQQYAEGFNKLIEYLNTKYPSAQTIIQKDLNAFIKLFTDGKYNKKIDLIAAYLNERDNKTRGEATRTLDKIIFLASIFAKTSTAAKDNFNALIKEMEMLIKNASYLLNMNRTNVTNIANPEMPIILGKVLNKLKNFFDATEKGKIKIDRSNPNQNVDEDFEIEDLLVEVEELLGDFLDMYGDLDQEMISMFGLPSISDVQLGVEGFLKSMENGIKKTFASNGGKWDSSYTLLVRTLISQYELKVYNVLAEFINTTNLLEARSKPETAKGVLAGILNLRTDLQQKNVKILNIALKTKVSAAVQRLLSAPLQRNSPVSEVITNMNKMLGEMLEITKDENMDVGVMAEKLSDVLVRLIDEAEKKIVDTYEEEAADIQLEMLKRLAKRAYKELALFGGNAGLLYNVKIFTTKEASNIISTIRPSDESDPRVFADAVSKMVKVFATKYTSSLDDNLTHNELAAAVAQEIKDFKKQNIKIDASTDKLWQVTTPQEFFRKLRKLFSGKVSLFDKIWEGYSKAVTRVENILADFHKEYVSFNKQNKGLQQYSYQQKVDVDMNFLVNIPSTKVQDLREEVTQEIKEIKENISDVSSKIDASRQQKAPINKQIKDLEAKKLSFQKGSYEWKAVQAQIRALKTQKAPIIAEEKVLRKEKNDLKSSLGLLSFDERLKVKIAEYIADPANVENVNQSLTRGEIISLYLSVSREIEMAEIEAQSRVNGEVNFINPTNHFKFGNQINIFDNELLRKEGYEIAKELTRPFTVFTIEKNELKSYLEGLLTDKDRQIIDFARNRFDQNYVLLNEEFEKRYQVSLPRQSIYIPFGTIEGDYKREFDLKLANRYNVGVADGLVTETTTGATTPLKIENIFGVMENHTRSTARYSYERLITDFQNLLVNKSAAGTSLQSTITGVGNWLGDQNKFLEYFTSMFVDLLGYNDINDTLLAKVLKWAIRQNRARALSFNLFSALRQLGSIGTIAIKNKARFFGIIKNLLSSAIFKDKYYKYLMENNANFYWRVQTGSIPDLARTIDTSLIIRASNIIDKINEIGTSPAARLDSAVLVATFKTFAEDIRKSNPSLTEDEVLAQANEKMKDVLLFGVANTNPAYRSHFSNSKKIEAQLFSKFQSENILQWAAFIRAWHGVQNKIPGSKDELLQAILSILMSALFGSAVTTASGLALGYTDMDDALFEFVVNDFVWGGVVGSIPMINQLTSLLQFDKDKFIKVGYEAQLPFFSQLVSIVEEFSYGLINQDTGEFNFRRASKIFQEALGVIGVPLNNIEKIFRLVFGLTGALGDNTSIELNQWFAGQTDAQALTAAVQSGSRAAINNYVEEAFNNTKVQNEIVNLLSNDSSLKLSLRNEDYFIDVQEDGTRKKVDIPSFKKSKYRRLQMSALMRLFTKGAYRRLSNKQKAQSIQRIINYYFNYMKAVILDDREDIVGTQGIDQVVERALTYED